MTKGNQTIEERLAALEAWCEKAAPYVNRLIPIGPRPRGREEEEERLKAITATIMTGLDKRFLPVDRSKQELVSGAPVPEDRGHVELKQNGQQKDYVVLSPEERAKGFVRPVRRSYIHKVCGNDTRMSQAIAETYARDPYFYSGTFCCACSSHFPLQQFVWKDNPDQQVGS